MVSVDLTRDEKSRQAVHTDRPKPNGFTVFITGLPGSGKSSLALGLRNRLLQEGRTLIRILDGEMFRASMPAQHYPTSVFRDVITARIAVVAEDVTRSGDIALCAAVAPFEAQREKARQRVRRVGGFFLVYLSTPLAVCEQRDRFDLYQGARLRLVEQLTGITHTYETPPRPDLALDTSHISIEASIVLVMELLRREALVR
jgi:sulfate adenylyltransferase